MIFNYLFLKKMDEVYVVVVKSDDTIEVLGVYNNKDKAINEVINYAIENEDLINNLYLEILNDEDKNKFPSLYEKYDFLEGFNNCKDVIDFSNQYKELIIDIFINDFDFHNINNHYFTHIITKQKIN